MYQIPSLRVEHVQKSVTYRDYSTRNNGRGKLLSLCTLFKLMIKVDEFAIPAGLLRHFDLTSTPTTSRRENYPGGLLFIDRLLALAEIDGNSTMFGQRE